MSKLIMLLACLLPAFTVIAQPEIKGSPNDLAQFLSTVPKLVTITGEGEVKMPADRAVITLKITSENRSLQEALRLNQDLRGKVTDHMKQQGLPADRVTAAKFSSTPKIGWFSDKAKSYHIENSLKVSVQDEKEFQTVSSAVDKWADVQYVGVEFEHANKEGLKKQAAAKACDNAIEHKKIYEDKFGVNLVPKRFSEGIAISRPAAESGDVYRERDNSVRSVKVYATPIPGSTSGADAEQISQFGELVYKAQVAVEYSVEAK